MVRVFSTFNAVFSALMAIAFMQIDNRGAAFALVIMAGIFAAIREVAE